MRLFVLFLLGSILASASAFAGPESNAALSIGKPCEELGAEKMDSNNANVLVCVSASPAAHELIWKTKNIGAFSGAPVACPYDAALSQSFLMRAVSNVGQPICTPMAMTNFSCPGGIAGFVNGVPKCAD
jgi:hypothetical protein